MAALLPARWRQQSRRERARPRAHGSDYRCYTGFDNANPTTERLPVVGGQEWPRSRKALAKQSCRSARRDGAPGLQRTPLFDRDHSVAAAPR